MFLCAGLLLAACERPDLETVPICERLVPGLESDGVAIEILSRRPIEADSNSVVVHYRVQSSGPFWLACRFSEQTTPVGSPRLLSATSDRWGEISQVRLFLLQRYWLEEASGAADRGK